MAMKIALVRSKNEDGSYDFVGVYFYTSKENLVRELDKMLDPSSCEYLSTTLRDAGGFNFSGSVSAQIENTYIKYTNSAQSLEDEIPTDPLDLMQYEGMSFGLMDSFTKPLMANNWEKF